MGGFIAEESLGAFAKFETAILRLIAEGAPLRETLEALIRLMEEGFPGMPCAVLTLSEDRERLQVEASAVLPESWRALIEKAEVGPGLAPYIDAICHRHPAFVADVQQEERWPEHRSLAAKLGLRAQWTVPIIAPDGTVIGAVALASAQSRVPDSREMEWVRKAGLLAGIALSRARGEQALRDSEERFRSLFENTPAMLQSIDPERRLLSVSNRWLEVMGYARNEVIGLEFPSFMTPESRQVAEEVVLPAFMKAGGIRDVPFQLVTKSGKVIDILLSAYGVRDASGRFIQSLSILTDVTSQKKTEAMLARARRHEIIGKLSGGVAHEFNNLLTSINGFASLSMQEIDPGSPVQGYLMEILKSGDRAAEITRQLLSYGRRQVLMTRVVNLAEVVEGMRDALRTMLPENILLEIEARPGRFPARLDQAQVESALVTLVTNARDAMPQGGKIAIQVGKAHQRMLYPSPMGQAAPGEYVVITVQDEGVGISAGVQARLFEPFESGSKWSPSAGLGLAAMDGFVRQSGGFITVHSEPRKGTTFRLHFPCAGPEETGKAAGSAKATAGVRPEPMTILLVEDEEVVRNYTQNILEQAGYRVVGAGSGEQALHHLQSEAWSGVRLLVVDIFLPGMDGMALAERASLLVPDLKVLFLSSFIDAHSPGAGKGMGKEAFLAKPFQPSELIARVRQLFREKAFS